MDLEPPDEDWVRNICKIGQGVECCRYITVGPGGWSCAKHTSLRALLDQRVAEKSIGSRGDNCDGKGAR